MDKLLNDQKLAEKMGKNARKRYEKLYSGFALGKAYSSLFDKIEKEA